MTREHPTSDMSDDRPDLSYQDWRKVASFWRAKATILEDELTSIVTLQPSELHLHSAAFSYRHDFGLLDPADQQGVMHEARFWLQAWQKEFRDIGNSADYRGQRSLLDQPEAQARFVGKLQQSAFLGVIAMMLGIRGTADIPRTEKAVIMDDVVERLIHEVMQMALGSAQNLHNDNLAVLDFTMAMSEKLARKRRDGRGGWADPDEVSQSDLSKMLRDHVEKGDTVDVANFAMMLHQRGEMISKEEGSSH